jgi:dGTPase
MDRKAKWKTFLSRKRLGSKTEKESATTQGRTTFQRDFDRIVFSSAFRRLQDKTQVVPFAKSDYVRTRLTHSIEASCLGRSLGKAVGVNLGCALPEDFEQFDGNAQGFRVLTRLQNPSNPGLQLSCATLGAFIKYPNDSGSGKGKFGYMQSERCFFEELVGHLKMSPQRSGEYSRHPLAFLVEAADDVCYRIMDFEDAFRLKHVDFDNVRDLFAAIIGEATTRLSSMPGNEQVAILRAKAINTVLSQVAECFLKKQEDILSGTFEGSLITHIACSEPLKTIKRLSRERYYRAREIVEIEVPAFDVLTGLLEAFIAAANDVAENQRPSAKSIKLLTLLPSQFLAAQGRPDDNKYHRILQITDFVSGMSDSYAVSLYGLIKGLSLPRSH